MASTLEMRPITLRAACAFVAKHHRHHKPPRGHLFSIAVTQDAVVVGVAIVGRPLARMLQDGFTAEVTRVCTVDGAPMGAASKLYSHAKRAAQALGYRRVLTYTLLDSEDGASIRAAGWTPTTTSAGGSWDRPNIDRRRTDKAPTVPKQRWEA